MTSRQRLLLDDADDMDTSSTMAQQAETVGYSWEGEYQRSWDVIQEDAHGQLSMGALRTQELLKRRKQKIDERVQRGIIRNLIVIVDMSMAMEDRDLKPSYLDLTVSYLKQFVLDFYDQNPIALLGFITTKDGLAFPLSELSGNLRQHLNALEQIRDLGLLKGEVSLQNAMEMVRSLLSHAPDHSSKETVMVMASMTSRDPSDITQTISNMRDEKIRCSIIGLNAEVHICRNICKETNGIYRVVLDEDHFKSCLWEMVPPPPVTADMSASSLLPMGFPLRTNNKVPVLCACHNKSVLDSYRCPRCIHHACAIPSDCSVCGLKLISSPHLARSYHHLFPVDAYTDLDTLPPRSAPVTEQQHCFACSTPFTQPKVASPVLSPTARPTVILDIHAKRFRCPSCLHCFCYDCDIFIHDTLHNCPGCV